MLSARRVETPITISHRPEITLSLIDMLIDTLEQHRLFPEVPVPEGAGRRQVIPFHSK
jgi:hypothetical protein